MEHFVVKCLLGAENQNLPEGVFVEVQVNANGEVRYSFSQIQMGRNTTNSDN